MSRGGRSWCGPGNRNSTAIPHPLAPKRAELQISVLAPFLLQASPAQMTILLYPCSTLVPVFPFLSIRRCQVTVPSRWPGSSEDQGC